MSAGQVPDVAPRLELRLGRLDNFLITAFFGFTATATPNPRVQLQERPSERRRSSTRSPPPTTPTPRRSWDKAQDLIAGRHARPSRSLNSTPPARLASTSRASRGSGDLTEFFNTVWLDQ